MYRDQICKNANRFAPREKQGQNSRFCQSISVRNIKLPENPEREAKLQSATAHSRNQFP